MTLLSFRQAIPFNTIIQNLLREKSLSISVESLHIAHTLKKRDHNCPSSDAAAAAGESSSSCLTVSTSRTFVLGGSRVVHTTVLAGLFRFGSAEIFIVCLGNDANMIQC
jgi:hypothetical protein